MRIFRNGRQDALADVVWQASEHPQASVSGFGRVGRAIIFGDVFPEGRKGEDVNFLEEPELGGYALGHEWGHYVYGLYDEYIGRNPNETRFSQPQVKDDPVDVSIMSNPSNAGGGNFEWLNHSTSNNFQAKTAQGRVYGASGWDVLIRDPKEDPRRGLRFLGILKRTRYTTLIGREPTVDDNWIKIELPDAQAACRDQLEIIWMPDAIEIQIVIDRSGSMTGSPLANAKEAAKNLVDAIPEGQTALGVISFASSPTQNQPITSIPNNDLFVKPSIKAVIDSISAGGFTAMFDAAELALTNLQAHQIANNTTATQLVFLLSDGEDNSSCATQASVTAQYQTADVPLITFGYGSFAPEGVLRELADNTGGLFFASPTTLADIQKAFLAAIATVSSSTNIASDAVAAPADGSTSSENFQVDSTLASFIIFANYTGSPGDVDFTLQGPGGAVPSVIFDCTAISSSTSCTAQVNTATVTAQGSGTWSVEIESTTGADIDVSINIVGAPRPVRTFDLTVAPLGGTEVIYPNPIVLTAVVSQGLPITGVNLTATVTDPNGGTSIIDMNDAGANEDAQADDGIYSAIIGYTTDGTYIVVTNLFIPLSTSVEGL